MSESTIVLSQLVIENCSAELHLNGAPLSRLTNDGISAENMAAEQWLIPGTNTIEVVVEPGSTPSIARTASKDLDYAKPMTAIGRLIRFRDGVKATVDNGELLVEARFEWRDGQPNRMQFPASASASADLGAAHGAWLWQSAPVLTLDEALIDEARALMDELEANIRGGNLEGLWRLTELQMMDCVRAFSAVSEEFLRGELASMIATYRGADPDPFIPRIREQHDFRLVCGGRLLQLVDKDFKPSFRLLDARTQQIAHFPTYVGRVGKELKVLR